MFWSVGTGNTAALISEHKRSWHLKKVNKVVISLICLCLMIVYLSTVPGNPVESTTTIVSNVEHIIETLKLEMQWLSKKVTAQEQDIVSLRKELKELLEEVK